MKLRVLLIAMTMGCLVYAQTTSAQVTKTIGGTGANYPTLKLAFDAVNAGTLTGAITLQITGSTTETAAATLNATGTGSANYSSVNIYPTLTGLSVSGNLAGPLISLNGADMVTIDGRVNATGSTKDLILTNSNTGTAASTIRLINSAENNTIKYCTIKGSETSATAGVIFFSTATAGNGNDGNLIDNNNLTGDAAGAPMNVVYSSGTSGHENGNNAISNNNIYDYIKAGSNSFGINLESYSTQWSITGNSFYEKAAYAPVSFIAALFGGIRINNPAGTNFTISGNFIGGRDALCGGAAWTVTLTSATVFYGIYINAGTSAASSIQQNTIRNFQWSGWGNNPWNGIYVAAGSVNIGTASGNTIGADNGNGSVTIENTNENGISYGMYADGSGDLAIKNNSIGSITTKNLPAKSHDFYAICRKGSGSTTISNNLIGSLTTAKSIDATIATTGNSQSVYGIYNTATGAISLTSNTIANLNNAFAGTSTSAQTIGIFSSSGTNTITGNAISNLTGATPQANFSATASVIGISQTSTTAGQTISGNSIYNLTNTNTLATFEGGVVGLYYNGPGSGTNNISANYIYNLTLSSNSGTSRIYGIQITAGATTCFNNIISLGSGVISGNYLFGISDDGADACNIYFNTVYIGGTAPGTSSPTFAMITSNNNSQRNYRNNLFINTRSGGSAGTHNAICVASKTNLAIDYNDYYAPGTGGVLGGNGNIYYRVNKATLADWKSFTGQDAGSLSTNPVFANPGSTNAIDYIPSASLPGAVISSILTDYIGTTRGTPPIMGALEGALNFKVDVYKSALFQSSYPRLKDAFDRINSGTHTGILEVRIKANTLEAASAVLNASGTGSASYTSINIFPTATGISVTGNIAAPLIDLNGADHVTIDGRVNATGSARDLTISNTNTGTNASTIRLIASAENNTLKYCFIKGAETSSGKGVIWFSTAGTGNGNDGNTIDNNNITGDAAGRPANAIYSAGTAGFENSGNTISGNNIYDFMNPNSNSYGIFLQYASSGWSLTGNSFYETTTLTPVAGNIYHAIHVSTLTSHAISGNFIGGSAASCGGAAMTVNSSFPHYFCGIFADGGTSVATIVENNVIRNIAYTSTQSNPWDGIFVSAGNVNVTGNTIGATTGNGSVSVTTPCASATAAMSGGAITSITLAGGGSGYIAAPVITFAQAGSTTPATATAVVSGGAVTSITLNTGGAGYTSVPEVYFDGAIYSTTHGVINASSGTVDISNNNIGSITTAGSATYSHGIESIFIRDNAGITTISNNLVGSLTTAGSIKTSTTAVSSPQKQDLYGIYSSSPGTTTVSGNTVANLANSLTGINGGSKTRGIQTSAGSNTIQNNTVRNVSTASGQTGLGSNASAAGIVQMSTASGTTQTVAGNTVYAISNTNPTARVDVYGIYFEGPNSSPAGMVSGNFVHSLFVSSSNIGSNMDGIALYNGLTTCANNIINLGVDIAAGYLINGIWDESGTTNNNNLYFNTVYIGGNVTSGSTTSSTAALWNKNNTSVRNYRNNILVNARSGGITGKHYAIRIAGTTSLTIDYNDYYVSGTNGILGYSGADKTTLALWKAATGQDAGSLNANPLFTGAGSILAADYKTGIDLNGISGTGITLDYGSNPRSHPTMGAWERNLVNKWKGTISHDWNTAGNWLGNTVPATDADIIFDDAPVNHCLLDQNRSVTSIFITQSAYRMVTNGFKLTVKGVLALSNGAQIDASAVNSTIEFAGAGSQSIPAGAFFNNEVYNLAVNNPGNVPLYGRLRLLNDLSAPSGRLDAFSNTPLVTYAGGATQNIGNGTYLNDNIYNLTIDNSSGVLLTGNVLNVSGGLTINSGKVFAVAPGKQLAVAGIIINNAGNAGFVLQSDETGTASLLHHTGNVPATVQRYINGNKEAWHFLSSPVADQDIGADQDSSSSWLPSGTYGNGTGYDLYVWNEPTNCWIYKLNTASPVNWNTVHPGADFVPGRGYLYSVQAANPTKSFVGNLNNGPVGYGLTGSSSDESLKGFNLVGNPYPSAIDWSAAGGWSRSVLVGSGGGYDMWIWNPAANNYGVYNSTDGDGVGTNSATRYLAPMQGFFVRAATAGNLVMDNPVRVSANVDWYKTGAIDDNRVTLNVKSEAGYGFDEIRLGFGYAANESGAKKLFSEILSAPSLFLKDQSNNLSVHFLTSPKENPVVPVSFSPGVDGNYTITCNFDQTRFDILMLEDRQKHYIQNLKGTNTYSFTASKSDESDRFVLYFGPDRDHPYNGLPGRIYSDGTRLIIDLVLVPEETDVFVYDMMGRLLLRQKLAGEIRHDLFFQSDAQVIIVYLKNSSGILCRKLMWPGNGL